MEFPKAEIETLWAPWRFEYFERERKADFLSEAARTSDDAAHLVVTRRKNAFLIMNRYPYTVGHLMAVPYRKVADLALLGDNEVLELWNLVAHGQALLRAVVDAQGFNVGLNLGECAGAGRGGSFASAHRAAMDWRHEFHADAQRTAGYFGRIAQPLRQVDGRRRPRSTRETRTSWLIPGSNRRRRNEEWAALPKAASF